VTSLLTFFGTAVSLWAAEAIVDGFNFDGELWQFLIVAAIVGLANAFVKPFVQLISLPLIVLTLGFFLIIVNALVLQFVVWLSGPEVLDLGLTSDGFWWSTFWASIVISVVGWMLGIVLPDKGGMAITT
jgi:putative membrane protein